MPLIVLLKNSILRTDGWDHKGESSSLSCFLGGSNSKLKTICFFSPSLQQSDIFTSL